MVDKILVVDDDNDHRSLLMTLLEEEGFQLSEARNGTEGLRLAHEKRPDLILMDVRMPDMDGYEVCSRLKKDPLFKDTPILFLSGMTKASDKTKGLEAGGSDYITKPFDQNEVMARVRSQLKISQLTHSLRDANEQLKTRKTNLEDDLKAAAHIQQSLIPKTNLDTESVSYAWRFIPCEDVGGDIFNIVPLDKYHTAIYILDVSGHGVSSAMITVSVTQSVSPQGGVVLKKGTHRNAFPKLVPPSDVLKQLDEDYSFDRFNKYFTMCYLILDHQTGQIRYSNGGHPPPFLFRKNGKVELLDRGGPLIGLKGRLSFEEAEIQLEPGDRIVLYTDGIFECVNYQGERYGLDRFRGTLESAQSKPLERVCDNIIQNLKKHLGPIPPKDDISFLMFEYKVERNGNGSQK